MRKERVAGLTVRMGGGIDGQAGGAGPAVVLLHGFGAPGDDLAQLGESMAGPPGTRWFFPAAPLTIPNGVGESLGWWMLDLERRQRDSSSGRARAIAQEIPTGLREARERVIALLHELTGRYRLEPEHAILGGFSQGAMLACDVVLRTTAPWAGLVLLSGALLAQEEWQPLMPKRRDLDVFMSHGHHDPILPAVGAEQLRCLLVGAGLRVEWHDFAGGHEIPECVLDRLGAFLHRALKR
jgi:phospholipase/carboxylesterase